jgi:hypothetical protein
MHGQVAERSIARDCKSLDESLRRFESFPSQIIYGPLAHLARAPRLHRGGEGFDSPKVQKFISFRVGIFLLFKKKLLL